MGASLWAQEYTRKPVDVCLALATDLDDSSIASTPYCSATGTLIHVDTDARVFGRNLETAMGVVADVGSFIRQLATMAYEEPLDAHAHGLAMSAIRASDPFLRHPGPSHPSNVVLALERALPSARFISDIGEHMLFALHYMTASTPERFHIQLGLGSMGSGVSGAIGLGLGAGGTQVVCIVGDGGMQMHGMEALLAVQHRLPILFAVFNDGRYNMVHHGMRQIFGEASAYATPSIDFAAWARAIGMPGDVVSGGPDIDASELESALAEGPYLLDIRVDPGAHMSGGGRIAALQRMSMTSVRTT